MKLRQFGRTGWEVSEIGYGIIAYRGAGRQSRFTIPVLLRS